MFEDFTCALVGSDGIIHCGLGYVNGWSKNQLNCVFSSCIVTDTSIIDQIPTITVYSSQNTTASTTDSNQLITN